MKVVLTVLRSTAEINWLENKIGSLEFKPRIVFKNFVFIKGMHSNSSVKTLGFWHRDDGIIQFFTLKAPRCVCVFTAALFGDGWPRHCCST